MLSVGLSLLFPVFGAHEISRVLSPHGTAAEESSTAPCDLGLVPEPPRGRLTSLS